MKTLEKIILVQFFVCDAEEIDIEGHTAFLGPNGTGKTSLLDAIQIVMLGADRRYLRFNAKKTTKEDNRNIRDYCLGYFRSGPEAEEKNPKKNTKAIVRSKRDSAHSYISLVFRDETSGQPITVGLGLTAHVNDPDHHVKGMFVANGVALDLYDHVEQEGDHGDTLRPLVWKDFEARLRRKAAAAHAHLEITDQSEKHVRAMLHALQPKGIHINPSEYQKAFKKSIHLSDIENVSDFVRDFLIEEEAFDKRHAMSRIADFRRLQDLIEGLQQQINELTHLQRLFEAVGKSERRLATINSLIATYQVEEAGDRYDRAIEGVNAANEDLKLCRERKADLTLEQEQIKSDLEAIGTALASEKGAQELQQYQRLLQALTNNRQQLRRHIEKDSLQLRTALDGLSSYLPNVNDKKAVEHAIARLQEIDDALAAAQLSPVSEALQSALQLVVHHHETVREAVRAANANAKESRAAYDEEAGSIENERRGGISLKGETAQALAVLTKAGIPAQPVCELVEVTDPHWQRALEAALGAARFALLVPAAQLIDAVALIGEGEARLPGVTLVDPAHVDMNFSADTEDASTLLEGDDSLAVAFLRERLRGLHRVSSHDQLCSLPRALTPDGLLSKDGSISILPLDLPLVLGRKRANVDETALQRRLSDALTRKVEAERALEDAQRLLTLVEGLGQPDTAESHRQHLADLAPVLADLDSTQKLIAAIDTTAIEELLSQQVSLKDRQTAVKQRFDKETTEEGGLLERVRTHSQARGQAEHDLERARKLENDLRSSIDYAPQMVDELRSRIDVDPAGKERDYWARINQCNDLLSTERRRSDRLKGDAHLAFGPFLDKYGHDVIEERSDWRKALAWIEVTRAKLVDSKLYEYEPEAKRARQVAEDSFRRDVALRLKEGIQRMQANIKDINRILDACPPFSNNERYQFKAKVPQHYEELHTFIMAADDEAATTDFLSNKPDISQQIFEMLNSGQDAEALKTPLDDFRLLFNFDLMIYENGALSTSLSKRIGTGSNGEHKTPFYVIAAAALAHAFRIDNNRKGTGTALMLMDEAFGDMDGTNATAAAKFISSLGIQMIMAAPSEASAKFYGFTHTLYDLDRFEDSLFFHHESLTEAGHLLMRSDMPTENPGLITDLLESYADHEPDRH